MKSNVDTYPNCSGSGQMCVACMKDSRSCSCSSGERTLTYCRPCDGLGRVEVFEVKFRQMFMLCFGVSFGFLILAGMAMPYSGAEHMRFFLGAGIIVALLTIGWALMNITWRDK